MLFRPPAMMIDPATAHRVYVLPDVPRQREHASTSAVSTRASRTWRRTRSRSRDAAGVHVERSRRRRRRCRARDARRQSSARVSSVSSTRRRRSAAISRPPRIEPPTARRSPCSATRCGRRSTAAGATCSDRRSRSGRRSTPIIGVAPRGFVGLWADQAAGAFIPITSRTAAHRPSGIKTKAIWWKTYSWGWMSMIVRRKPGVTHRGGERRSHAGAAVKSYETQLVEQSARHADRARASRTRSPDRSSPSAGRTQSSVAKVATWVGGRVGHRAAHRLRQRREPAARARASPAARDRACDSRSA